MEIFYDVLKYGGIILAGYLIGSSSMSFYISKFKKINLKEKGSKNLGASNTLAIIGKKAAAAVLVHDVLKSFFAILAVRILLDIPYNEVHWLLAAVGVAAVVGHIFPFYLKFKGGKGFATYIGLIFGLDWRLFLAVVALIFVVAFITDYIVSGTFSTIVAGPVYYALIQPNLRVALIVLLGSLVILWKHRENIRNLKNGKEMKIRSAFQNKYKQAS